MPHEPPGSSGPLAGRLRIVPWQIAAGFLALMVMGGCGVILTTLVAASDTDCFRAARNAEGAASQPIWRAPTDDPEATTMAVAIEQADWRWSNDSREWTSIQWVNRSGNYALAGGTTVRAEGPLGPCRPVENKGVVLLMSKQNGTWRAAYSGTSDRLLLGCRDAPFTATERTAAGGTDVLLAFERACINLPASGLARELTVRLADRRWTAL
jgi:hypothetical protein